VTTRIQFSPRLDREYAARLCACYDTSNDKIAEDAGRAIAGGDYSVIHFERIVAWKTNGRGRSRLRLNKPEEVRDALWLAHVAKTPRASIAVLMGLHGVDVPVASSVMAMVSPTTHTVIDYRALEALDYDGPNRSLSFYLHYRTYCEKLAAEWDLSLRDLDRALWQWSKDRTAVSLTSI
jgi:hypothetical protein